MLIKQENNSVNNYRMYLSYNKEVSIEFKSINEYLNQFKKEKKIIFIDPIVLGNQKIFLDLENEDQNLILVPTNLHESNKDIDSLVSIIDVFESNGVGRRGEIICAIGGGALLDTVSLAASIYRRGIAVVKVPTTLLGIVDASIGIKTGVNYKNQRNRVGSYHFDYHVVIDPILMTGLHRSLLRQGLGEIFKIAVIKSEILFEKLIIHKDELDNINFYSSIEGHSILTMSIEMMLEELHDNPREDNLMRCVDFGHSFSPLIEMESINRLGYRSLPHGYAVAYDCLLTSTIANQRKILATIDYNKIINLFNKFEFDLKNEIYKDYNLLWASFLEMKKHRGGKQNLPIPTSIGAYSFIQDLTFEEMVNSVNKLNSLLI